MFLLLAAEHMVMVCLLTHELTLFKLHGQTEPKGLSSALELLAVFFFPITMSTSSGEMSVLLAKMEPMQQQNSLEQALIKQQLSRLSQFVEALHAKQAQQSDQYSHASAAPEDQQQHMHQRARRAVDQEPVLARDEVLDTVLSFVGIGEYYYVAGVCRNWRGRYISVCSQTKNSSKKKLNCASKFRTLLCVSGTCIVELVYSHDINLL
jgi:hypothetical protein